MPHCRGTWCKEDIFALIHLEVWEEKLRKNPLKQDKRRELSDRLLRAGYEDFAHEIMTGKTTEDEEHGKLDMINVALDNLEYHVIWVLISSCIPKSDLNSLLPRGKRVPETEFIS